MPLFWAAGIAAAGSIGGALISSNASNKAADATGAAAASATAEQARQFDISRTTQQPWLTTGSSALQKLAGLYGLDTFTNPPPGSANGAPGAAQPQAPSGNSLTPGMMAAQAAAGTRGGGGTDIGSGLMTGFIGSRKNNSPIQDISQALGAGRTITDAQWDQAGYGPGGAARDGSGALQTPTLAQANPNIAQPGSATGFTPGGAQPSVDPNADFYKSPDYAFRVSEGLKGLEARASTGVFGGLDSGALRKAEIGYAGNLASGEFNNYANRLATLAGVGQTTATNLAGQGQAYANNVGNIAVNQGNNRASSYLANGQTYGNAVGNLAGIGAGLITNNSSYNPASGGMYNGSYMAPFNSSAAAAGY